MFRRNLTQCALAGLSLCMLWPAAGLAGRIEQTEVPLNCNVTYDIVYLEGLILQGSDYDYYLYTGGTCVANSADEPENYVVQTDLVELRCGDDGWNYHQKERGTEKTFRGLIYAIPPGQIVLSCHMPL